MPWDSLFQSEYFKRVTHELRLVALLAERYGDEKPFRGLQIVFGHYLAGNSLALIKALHAGGAQLVISDPFHTQVAERVTQELARHAIQVYPVREAVAGGDLFFDVNAMLGRQRTPLGAVEVTRTGILHYEWIPCVVVSADDSRAKRIEGYFGIGDGLVRAWNHLLPDSSLGGKRVVQFGYGKIGRGVAHQLQLNQAPVTIVEASSVAQDLAEREGFMAIGVEDSAAVRKVLREADVVVAVTGVPGVLGKTIPEDWLRANQPVFINIGAEDEYGPHISDDEVLGGKSVPINFHLEEPTRNRYIDPTFAAHLLAMEHLVQSVEGYEVGIHPLPARDDQWVLSTWQRLWPEEDLKAILPA